MGVTVICYVLQTNPSKGTRNNKRIDKINNNQLLKVLATNFIINLLYRIPVSEKLTAYFKWMQRAQMSGSMKGNVMLCFESSRLD